MRAVVPATAMRAVVPTTAMRAVVPTTAMRAAVPALATRSAVLGVVTRAALLAAAIVSIGLLACAREALAANPGTASPLPESDYTVRDACAPPSPGYASCMALRLVPLTAEARAHRHPIGSRRRTTVTAAHARSATVGEEAEAGHFGLRPADLHSAYSLPADASSAQTIAIVDSYNDPTAEEDLRTYSQAFGLPACESSTGCFRQVNEKGESSESRLPFPRTTLALEDAERGSELEQYEAEEARGWDGEISLDIETAHAVCENCHILLVEAASPSDGDLDEAEQTAAALGANEISNSWGGPEASREDVGAFDHPGTVITAATGDDGYLNWELVNGEQSERERRELEHADYPASSPDVVAVGGTSLELSVGGGWAGEKVWNDRYGATSGGCSDLFTAPAWQQAVSDWAQVGCGSERAAADISADADPRSGVATYDSQAKSGECQYTSEPHWCTVGGTSLSSPLVAAVFALAGGAHGVAYPAQTLYERAAGDPATLHDVTEGSSGRCETPEACTYAQEASESKCTGLLICLAGAGYDGPSGLGTPDGLAAFEPRAPETGIAAGPPVVVPTTRPAEPAASAPSASISSLALIHSAIAALARVSARARASVSSVAFSFIASARTKVRVVLAKRVLVNRRARWQVLPYSLEITAAKGRNRAHLSSRGRLAPGVYELTLTPAGGVARSMTLRVG
jgi:hypothetical protein